MKARLESRAPSEVWLVIENDTDAGTELQAVKTIVRWKDPALQAPDKSLAETTAGSPAAKLTTRSSQWKPYPMLIGPGMTFRLDVTNLLRKLIEDELPKLPAAKSLDCAAELFTGANGTIVSVGLCLRYEAAHHSFAPLP